MEKTTLIFGLLLITTILASCHRGRSTYMTEQQREQLETTYDSLQNAYKTLVAEYETSPDSLPADLQSLYAQMQQMHGQMETNHRQMMSGDMGGGHMQGDGMMGGGMRMSMQRQGHMTGEWYQQMMGMHGQMAAMHREMGQQSMAEMHRQLSDRFGKMMKMIPGIDEPSGVSSNEEIDPSALNGKTLYAQNCASCHGSDAGGIAGVFPPLVNSKWVTGDKSVPLRILLHGLSGEIEVSGQTYRGSMPSFRARLSEAEMAAILNYLRGQSEDDLPEITQDDVSRVAKTYSKRNRPWNASELQPQSNE
jgi:mono/diheme cytochrome c family protein